MQSRENCMKKLKNCAPLAERCSVLFAAMQSLAAHGGVTALSLKVLYLWKRLVFKRFIQRVFKRVLSNFCQNVLSKWKFSMWRGGIAAPPLSQMVEAACDAARAVIRSYTTKEPRLRFPRTARRTVSLSSFRLPSRGLGP